MQIDLLFNQAHKGRQDHQVNKGNEASPGKQVQQDHQDHKAPEVREVNQALQVKQDHVENQDPRVSLALLELLVSVVREAQQAQQDL